MKKLQILAIASVAIVLAACGGKSGEATADKDSTETTTMSADYFYTYHDINGARVFVPKGWKIDSKNEKGVHLNKAQKPKKDASLDIVSYGSGSSASYVEESSKALSSSYSQADDVTLGKLTYKHFVKQFEDGTYRHDLWADYPDGQGFLQVTVNGYDMEDADIQAIFNQMMIAN